MCSASELNKEPFCAQIESKITLNEVYAKGSGQEMVNMMIETNYTKTKVIQL
jgi:hypothetical protein